MMTPFESAVRGSLEGSHGDRVLVRDDHEATALHHYRGLNRSRERLGQRARAGLVLRLLGLDVPLHQTLEAHEDLEFARLASGFALNLSS